MLKYQNENETQIWPSSEINNCLPNGKIQTVLETNTLLWLWVCFANIGNNYLRCLFQNAVQNNKHMATVHPAKKKKAGQDPESWWSPVIQQQEARTWTSLTFWGDLMIKDGALSLCFLPWRNKLNPQNSPDGWIHRKHTGVTLLHGLPVVRENWAL